MASYKSKFNVTDLQEFPKALRSMKSEGVLKDRDMDPLNFAKSPTGYNFIRYLLLKATALISDENVSKTVDDEFTSSINRLKNNPQANLAATEEGSDSLVTFESEEFHTMTALGRQRSNFSEGVIRGMSSVPGGTTAMIQYLFLLDENNQPIDGEFFLNTPGKAFGEVGLQTNLPAGDTGIDGVYVVHYFIKENNSVKDFIGIQYWQTPEYPATDPEIDAPVQRNNNQNYFNIVIGLGRGTTVLVIHADADYSYSNLATGQAYIPFQGSIHLGSEIEDITQPGNLKAKFFINTARGSVRQLQNNNWNRYIRVSPSDRMKLEWNWPTGDLAYFGPINWGVDHAVYLHFEVGVKTRNSNNEFVYTQIHSVDKEFVPTDLRITDNYVGSHDDVVDGIAYTYPVEHSWHCVAAGTVVTMEDGSTKLIDDVKGGEMLRVDSQNTMEVRSTVEQPAMDNDTVYELTDSQGNTLLITGDHWIAQPDGYKPVEELAQSDEILTVLGTATIQSLRKVEFEGTLFSLSLGNHEQRPTIGFEGTTFVANNILIADNQLCRIQNLLRLKDHEHITAKLPAEWKVVADALQAQAS